MKYLLAIFDMDGTLLNTLEDLRACLNYALSSNGLPESNVDEVRRFVGNGIRKLVERGVPDGTSAEEIDAVHKAFIEYYKQHYADKTKPYEGIIEAVRELRAVGIKTAVVSNKADFAVQQLNERFFDGLFDVAVGEKEGIRKKPAPDSVFEAMRILGMSKNNSVYIGDSDVDIKTAENADIPCISVLWGFRDRDFLLENGATVFAETPEGLKGLII